ncbi:metabotropic glutamate receptor 2-like [Littorina saxatilis]|uniref:G-protein coupled receptors family 3 profile domain-containing protein n=1 Tax=Littorina saxatilis TaxID=31220 RepID=A0AAN9FVM1_9CAEN
MKMRRLSMLVLLLALVGFGSCVFPATCPNQASTCPFSGTVPKVAYNSIGQEKFAIGGIFDVYTKGPDAFSCGTGFNPQGILLSHAFLWSVEYWRQRMANSTVAVGGFVLDSCGSSNQMIQNILGFEQCNIRIPDFDRNQVVGFVGPTSNMDAMAAARLTSKMDLTVISPSADSTMLSDHGQYPYFLRTKPSIQVDVDVMAAVLRQTQTKYAAAIYLQSEMDTFRLFQEKMNMSNICISASYSMTGNETDSIIDDFVNTKLKELERTRFIALFLSSEFAGKFMTRVQANGDVKSLNLVFLTTSDVGMNTPAFSASNTVAAENAFVLEQQVPNSIMTAVDAFKTYWNLNTLKQSLNNSNNAIQDPFLSKYLSNTTNIFPPFDVDAAFTIMATKAFLDGVRGAGNEICQNNNNYLCSTFFGTDSRGSKINEKIRTSTGFFTEPVNGVYQNGDPASSQIKTSVYRFKIDGTFDKIGEYVNGNLVVESNAGLNLVPYGPSRCHVSPCLPCGEMPTTTTTTTEAPSTTVPICKPPFGGNFSVVYYPPDQEITGAYMKTSRKDSEFATRFEIGRKWIIALGALAGLGILAVIIFEIYILYKMLGTQMGQKWRTMWLGQLLLFGIFLCYLTLFAYLPTPTKATCGITRFGVGVSYSICFAVLLVKLMVILTSKNTDNSLIPGDGESGNYLKGIYQFLMFVFVVGVQVVIDAQWLITVPPEAVKVVTNNGGEAWICNHYTFRASGELNSMMAMSEFVRNEFENHILSLVYIMFLILITTVLALNAHGIITNHRESVFIGIAAGFSIPVWLAWTLVGGLNRDHDYAHEFGDACIAFGLFITATLVLFSMFLPKVRQLVNMGVEGIYFEDDRETYYAGSVIMAPPSYKSRPNSRPNSVIYVNNQGIYSEPIVVGNGETGSNHLRHPGTAYPGSTYSAPPTYLKKGADSTIRGGSVLRVTDDLSGRRPLEKKRPMSEVAYGTTASRPRSTRGTLPRSRSHNNLGAL